METEGIEGWRVISLKGVFLAVHSYARFPYRLQSWTFENSMDLCVPLSLPHTLPSINLNYNNELNWASKPAAISELYNWAQLQPACYVNTWDIMIIIHASPVKQLHTQFHRTQS